MDQFNWGKPSTIKKKEKLDYHSNKMVMSIIQPSEGEKNTNLLFNTKAATALGLTEKNHVVSISFTPEVIVANLTNQKEADGQRFFTTYRNNEYAGTYFSSKPMAEALSKQLGLTFTEGVAHIELASFECEDFPVLSIVGQVTDTITYEEAAELTATEESSI